MAVLVGPQEPLDSKDPNAKDGAAISGEAGLEYKSNWKINPFLNFETRR